MRSEIICQHSKTKFLYQGQRTVIDASKNILDEAEYVLPDGHIEICLRCGTEVPSPKLQIDLNPDNHKIRMIRTIDLSKRAPSETFRQRAFIPF
jgi:hypothetical protein